MNFCERIKCCSNYTFLNIFTLIDCIFKYYNYILFNKYIFKVSELTSKNYKFSHIYVKFIASHCFQKCFATCSSNKVKYLKQLHY